MKHTILTDAAKSELLNGVFLDIETGVVLASDGIVGAAWKPSGNFIDARVCINERRTRATFDTLISLHDAESIGRMEIDLAVLKRALDALMVDGSKDAPIRQGTLSIRQPKPDVFILEIVERTMTSDAGTTLLLMGVKTQSRVAPSVFDLILRAPKQHAAGDATSADNTEGNASHTEVKS